MSGSSFHDSQIPRILCTHTHTVRCVTVVIITVAHGRNDFSRCFYTATRLHSEGKEKKEKMKERKRPTRVDVTRARALSVKRKRKSVKVA